jgi:hypothetical protein
LVDDIIQHMVRNDDWPNDEALERLGFLTCSQARLFAFLEDVLDPIRRDETEQERIVAVLNPVLNRDGYSLKRTGHRSGYPVYTVEQTTPTGARP